MNLIRNSPSYQDKPMTEQQMKARGRGKFVGRGEKLWALSKENGSGNEDQNKLWSGLYYLRNGEWHQVNKAKALAARKQNSKLMIREGLKEKFKVDRVSRLAVEGVQHPVHGQQFAAALYEIVPKGVKAVSKRDAISAHVLVARRQGQLASERLAKARRAKGLSSGGVRKSSVVRPRIF